MVGCLVRARLAWPSFAHTGLLAQESRCIMSLQKNSEDVVSFHRTVATLRGIFTGEEPEAGSSAGLKSFVWRMG